MRCISNLELHVVHGCNLACESCSHYSNHGHKGVLSLEQADDWMRLWNRRLAPRTFSLLGGEPTIHPELSGFLELARGHWPAASLRVVTNGFFLHRHPDLPRVMRDDPNTCLYLSIHQHSAEYLEQLKPVVVLLNQWIEQYGIQVSCYHSYKSWTRRYHGFGSEMEPFADGQPRRSWEHCPAKYCPQLFEGKIWKCAPLAYLKMQNAKYHLSENWRPFLGYRPLESDCPDEELHRFFDREEESYCGMCPANPERFQPSITRSTRREGPEESSLATIAIR